MGKAIIISDVAFSKNIGKVTITGGDTPSVIEITGLNIANKPSSMENNAQLSVSYIPSNTTQKGVSWRSSNENVAIVDGTGYVTLKSAGTVTITATSIYNSVLTDSFTAICSISSVYVPVTSISVLGATSGMVGGAMQLSCSVLPSNATQKGVSWRSSNESIATVNSTGYVTLKSAGTVTITATSLSETSVSGTTSITVTSSSAGTGSAADIYNSYLAESGRPETPQLLNMLSELKDGGVLDKLDGLYYLAGANFSQVKINIVSPDGYPLVSGHSLYEYIIDSNGIKSTGAYKGVLQCRDFKMSLKSKLSYGVYASTPPQASEAVCGFTYGKTNDSIVVFPGKYNSSNIVLWGGSALVKDSSLSTVDTQGCYFISYDATTGDGLYLSDNADAMFNKKTSNEVADSDLNYFGVLANNSGSATPSQWGTTAYLKFAFVTNKNALSLSELKKLRTAFNKYAALL